MILFVFGTLLFDEIVRALIERTPLARPATLAGYRRAEIREPGRLARGPAIVESPGSTVSGRVLVGVDERELRIIDLFEAEAGGYRRITGTVLVEAAQKTADFYVATERLRPYLSEEDWAETRFRSEYLNHYVAERIPALLRRWKAEGRIVSGLGGE